jgi:hypothetical protein
MPKLRLAVTCAVILVSSAGSASAGGAIPPDPSSNFAASPNCSSAATCLAQAIQFLNEARARLGQPPYQLPRNFSQLSPPEQVFVLTNLDRALYGLRPIAGLTGPLDDAAAAGVRDDLDPVSDIPSLTVTSNWAGDFPSLPLAYEAWMYDDGPGGDNLDCLSLAGSGCWDHRHNVLWPFAGSGLLLMGAAGGSDAHGSPGAAMLLVEAPSGYRPAYLYTWDQAVAAGAGDVAVETSHHRARATRAAFRITLLRVRARSLSFRILAPRGVRLRCSLTRLRHQDRFRPCGSATTYRRLRVGVYRLRVKAARRVLTRLVIVH